MEEYSVNMIAIGWWQVGIASCTLIALIIYAWDTRQLRITAELQRRDARRQLNILKQQNELLVGQLMQSAAPYFTNFEKGPRETHQMVMSCVNQGGRITRARLRSKTASVEFFPPTFEVIDSGDKIDIQITSINPSLKDLKDGRYFIDFTNSLGTSDTQEFYWRWGDNSIGPV